MANISQPSGEEITPARIERENSGRFGPGNRAAKGNPNNKRAQLLRNALLQAVTTDDVRDIILKQVAMAKNGDTDAARLVLDRTLGKVAQSIDVIRLHPLNASLEVSADDDAGED